MWFKIDLASARALPESVFNWAIRLSRARVVTVPLASLTKGAGSKQTFFTVFCWFILQLWKKFALTSI